METGHMMVLICPRVSVPRPGLQSASAKPNLTCQLDALNVASVATIGFFP